MTEATGWNTSNFLNDDDLEMVTGSALANGYVPNSPAYMNYLWHHGWYHPPNPADHHGH